MSECPFCGLFPENVWRLATYCDTHYAEGFTAWLKERRRSVFTSDDIVADIGLPAEPNHLGALVQAAAKRGEIEPIGFAKSSRITTHGRWIREWRLCA